MPRFPRSSPTTGSLSSGVFSALAERARHHAGAIYPLHVGDTWRDPWEGARAESLTLADTPHLHTYAPVQGEPALLTAARARVEARSGRHLEPDQLCVVSGATSGLSVIAQSILDPDDEVLLPSPFWPLIRGIIASRGAVPVQIPLWDRLDDAGFDIEAALEAAVTERTAALYLNSPHNPTGKMLGPEEIAACARVARRHDLWVLCDEVYEDIYFGEAPPEPGWARDDLIERSVVVHSMSKAYGYAGGRVGYVHGPSAVMKAIRSTQTYQVYCAPKPMQIGAARAIAGGDAWLAETRSLYRAAAAKTAALFGLAPPAGGTFMFVDVSRWLAADAEDSSAFLFRCLDEAGVLLTPGAACGEAYEKWVRVCFTSVAPAALDEALARLRPIVEQR